jgi:hypothetical protein
MQRIARDLSSGSKSSSAEHGIEHAQLRRTSINAFCRRISLNKQGKNHA